MTPQQLARLSDLLDEALDLDGPERERWLDALARNDAELGATVRGLLARDAAGETAQVLQRGLAFAVPAAAAARDFAVGDRVGPYRLQRELGAGGMGEVWLAERADGALTRQVALKLPTLGQRRALLVQRFARERDILAGLEHPHIARLYDAGFADDGQPYLALEYVEGLSIDQWCRTQRPTLAARLELLLQVAEAVAFAHSRLVLHRDLKPNNILVTREGQVRLLDFGIAKLMEGEEAQATELTRAGGRALTLRYASPEQVHGDTLSTASDVYSLGVVAYEVLSGTSPYGEALRSPLALQEAIAGAELPPASARCEDPAQRKQLRGDLDAILQQALKKHPRERYATVDALAADWRRHRQGERVAARRDSLAYRAARLLRRHRVPLAAAALVLAAFGLAIGAGATALVVLALLMGLALALWQARRAREQARMARTEARRAKAVQDFVLDIFRANSDHQSDPAKARATTARELLDMGAQRVESALRDVPEARAEMLDTLGELYYQLQLDEQAAAIDEKRIALLRQLHGPDDRRVALALIHLTGALHSTARREQILPALHEAQRILDAAGEGASFTRAELLSRLAQRYYNLSKARAIEYADAAVRMWRELPTPDPDHLAAALMLGARTRSACGQLAAAARGFRAAIVELQSLPATPQVQMQEARVSLAEVLAQQLRTEEALALAQQAAQDGLAALGESDPGTIAAQSRWAALLHMRGRRAQARELMAQALERALAVRGEGDTLYVPLVRGNAARCHLADGAPAQALALAEQVNRINRQHYAGSMVLGMTLRAEAAALAALGRGDEARRLLLEGLAIFERDAEGGVVQHWRFNRLHLDLARAELAAGQADAALERLRPVAAANDEDIPSPQPDLIERNILAARAELARGDAAAAEASATTAALALPALVARGRHPSLEAEAAQTLGLALLAGGRAEAALPSLQLALRLRSEFELATSASIDEARRALERCLQACTRA